MNPRWSECAGVGPPVRLRLRLISEDDRLRALKEPKQRSAVPTHRPARPHIFEIVVRQCPGVSEIEHIRNRGPLGDSLRDYKRGPWPAGRIDDGWSAFLAEFRRSLYRGPNPAHGRVRVIAPCLSGTNQFTKTGPKRSVLRCTRVACCYRGPAFCSLALSFFSPRLQRLPGVARSNTNDLRGRGNHVQQLRVVTLIVARIERNDAGPPAQGRQLLHEAERPMHPRASVRWKIIGDHQDRSWRPLTYH